MIGGHSLGGLAGQQSENTAESYTPPAIFDVLNREFDFTLDPCEATFGPKLCPTGFNIADNGLTMAWKGRVYMNPPYGRSIGQWIKKAYDEANWRAEIVVALVPVRADTKW